MSRTARKLIDLLEAERKALLGGKIAEAIGLTDRKTSLVSRLETETPDEAAIRAVRAAAQRNEVLLSAALEGVRSAREKVGAILAAKPLRTYSPDGRSMALGPCGGDFERRA